MPPVINSHLDPRDLVVIGDTAAPLALPSSAMTIPNPIDPIPGNFPLPGGNIPLPGGNIPLPGGNIPLPGGNLPGNFPPIPPLPPIPGGNIDWDDLLPQLPELPGFNWEDLLPQLPPITPGIDWEDLLPQFPVIPEIDWGALLPNFPVLPIPPILPIPPSFFDTTTVTTQGNSYSVPSNTQSLTSQFLQNADTTQINSFEGNGGAFVAQPLMDVDASSWQQSFAINRVARAGVDGANLQAKQLDFDPAALPSSQDVQIAGSILQGSDVNDVLHGLGGWEIIDAKGGDDLVHGGNGRDIISGGSGSDELHGDFGWNTYTSQIDGAVDLIAIKSDQHLHNWWYDKAGNSPNGEKADIIEGLDANDQIKILGVASDQITFANASAHGVNGIGIYADGALEAVYTGSNLSMEQLQSMTSGDNSDAVMANQLWSYNFGAVQPTF